MSRARMIVCTAVALGAVPFAAALAQTTPVGDAIVATAPAKTSSQAVTDAQIDDWIKGAPPLGLSGDDGGVIQAAPDRGVHGEAGAFVSNRGYGGYVAATAPVGKDAVVGVAVGDEHFNGRYFRGDQRSLGASLRVGPTAQAQRSAQCPSGVQVGGRYVQPVWVDQVRAAPAPADLGDCFTPAASTAR